LQENIENHFLEILKTDSSRAIADILVDKIGNNHKYFQIIFNFCISKPYPISMRAARVIQLCSEKNTKLIEPFHNNLISIILETNVEGVKRGFLKILSEMKDITKLIDCGILVDKCFEWIASQRENPAIRCYSINLIYNLYKIEPQLKNEFIFALNIAKEDKSSAVKYKAIKTFSFL